MNDKNKIMLLRLIVGAVGFLACVLFDFNSSVKLIAFLTLYIILAYDVLIDAARNVFTLKFLDENFLMAVASIGAFLIGEYLEAVSVMLFYQTGELFLNIAVDKSRKSISSLMDLNAEYANKYEDGEVKIVSPYDIQIGDKILVKTGEKIPVDCVVLEGESSIDTAALTGESIPKTVAVGDEVLSGSVNLSAGFIAEVKKEYMDSTAMKTIELAENAAHKKAKTEKFITKFAKYYTPAVVIMAVVISVIPPLLTGDGFSEWITRGLSFLVVSCPCALVISVPMGFFAGIGAASTKGCIVKGGIVIEELAKVKIAAFDKTGTLTNGKIKIKEFICDSDKNEVLRLAALAESFNNHPVGKAIVEYYGEEIDVSKVLDAREFAGKGVVCVIDGKKVCVGNSSLMEQEGIFAENEGESMVYIAVDSQIKAKMKFGDEVKNNAEESLEALKSYGIVKNIMLTGDSEKSAKEIAEKLGIDLSFHSLLPSDKLKIVEDIRLKENCKIMFTGDGINDSPVLAAADVGIAMGHSGSDAAIEAADIVIMNDDLSSIGEMLKISRKTVRIIRQNIIFAIGIKFLILILCSVGLAGMWAAVFADVGVAVLAVLNSLRCFKVDKKAQI